MEDIVDFVTIGLSFLAGVVSTIAFQLGKTCVDVHGSRYGVPLLKDTAKKALLNANVIIPIIAATPFNFVGFMLYLAGADDLRGLGLAGIFATIIAVLAFLWNFRREYKFHSKIVEDKIQQESDLAWYERIASLNGKLNRENSTGKTSFKRLKVAYDKYFELIENERINPDIAKNIQSHLDNLYLKCLDQLENSYDLFRTIKNIEEDDPNYDELSSQREEILAEIVKTVETMEKGLEYYLQTPDNEGEINALVDMREELNATLEAARRVETFTSDLSAEIKTFQKKESK